MGTGADKDTYVDPFVEEAQRRPQEEGTEPAVGRQAACGRKGCYLPWVDHLTAKGNVRRAYAGHVPAGEGAPSRAFDRAKIRKLMTGRGSSRPSLAARRAAPASFETHIVVLQGGKKTRLTLAEFAEMMDEARDSRQN